jgi:hypothetical protein
MGGWEQGWRLSPRCAGAVGREPRHRGGCGGWRSEGGEERSELCIVGGPQVCCASWASGGSTDVKQRVRGRETITWGRRWGERGQSFMQRRGESTWWTIPFGSF